MSNIKKSKNSSVKISKQVFEDMYYSMTVKELAEKLGVSQTIIYLKLKELGIAKKGKGYGNRKLEIGE